MISFLQGAPVYLREDHVDLRKVLDRLCFFVGSSVDLHKVVRIDIDLIPCVDIPQRTVSYTILEISPWTVDPLTLTQITEFVFVNQSQ